MASEEDGMTDISTDISMVILKHSMRKSVLNDQKDMRRQKQGMESLPPFQNSLSLCVFSFPFKWRVLCDF